MNNPVDLRPTNPLELILPPPLPPSYRRGRTRASRADAEGLIETSAQDRSRPPLSGGIKGDVGFYRGYLPLDHTQELDRSGRRSLEGDALPQLMVAGEAQVCEQVYYFAPLVLFAKLVGVKLTAGCGMYVSVLFMSRLEDSV